MRICHLKNKNTHGFYSQKVPRHHSCTILFLQGKSTVIDDLNMKLLCTNNSAWPITMGISPCCFRLALCIVWTSDYVLHGLFTRQNANSSFGSQLVGPVKANFSTFSLWIIKTKAIIVTTYRVVNVLKSNIRLTIQTFLYLCLFFIITKNPSA